MKESNHLNFNNIFLYFKIKLQGISYYLLISLAHVFTGFSFSWSAFRNLALRNPVLCPDNDLNLNGSNFFKCQDKN